MSSPGFSGVRWLIVVVPLLLVGCFVVGDDEGDGGGGGDDDPGSGCTSDEDCREPRVCVDLDGNRDDICNDGERCACATPGSSTGGTSGGGSSGSSNGGTSGSSSGASSGGTSSGGTTSGGTTSGGTTSGGTSSGGTATGGTAGSPTCDAYCGRLVEAMCGATTDGTACRLQCGQLSVDCPMQLEPLSTCIADPTNMVACMAGQTVIQGCDAEIEAMDRCFVCLPETTDTACQTCSKSSCCEPLGDYNVAPDAQAFFNCANACTTAACFDGCVAMYPIAGAAIQAVVECQNGACPEPCICGASTGDTACQTCNKTNCCSEYVDYSLTSDVDEFEACAIPCTTDPCFEACLDQFPNAGAAYGPWSECLDTSCLVECGP